MSDHDRIRERERAHQAKNVLENVVYQEAFTHMEGNLMATMQYPKSSDEAVLEARRMLIVLRNVQRHLEEAMQTGILAEIQLERSKHGRTHD